MVLASQNLGVTLSKSQVDRDYHEGAPRHSARAFLAWRAAYRELGRTADSRIDRPQTPVTDTPPARPGASSESESALGDAGGASSSGGPPANPDADDEPVVVDEHSLAYRKDRASNERIKAERAQIELDQLRGALVPLRDMEDFEFTAGRIVRDRIEMVPPRVSADLHALVLSMVPEQHRAAVGGALELHLFERRLADALREALADAAKATEEARRDDDDPDTD